MSIGAVTDPFDPDWTRRPPGRANYLHDAASAGVLFVATFSSATLFASAELVNTADPRVSALWALALTLPLALRRRFPATVGLLVAVVYIIGLVLAVPESLFNEICLFLVIYTVGAWGRNRRVSLLVQIVIAVGMLSWLIASLAAGQQPGRAAPTQNSAGIFPPYFAESVLVLGANVLYFGSAYMFGETSRQSARRLEALEARTAELDEERELSSRQAVSSERLRIARELHDVVAHHVSVMGVQAGAARRVLAQDPEKAVAALSAIEKDARSAIEEMRRILVALRTEDTGPNLLTDAASTRGVEQLEELVAASTGSGLPTVFRTFGEPRAIPATVGLSLYRIAQESLTNVRKHAGRGACAEVRLVYFTDAVELKITNDAGAAPHPVAPTSCGLGQTGMIERAAAVGGWVQAGPLHDGYLVHAHIPLSPVTAHEQREDTDQIVFPPTSMGNLDRASRGNA
ncbi:sensor histidine kinase [Rathayibacter toxicus]|uniref:histidine kinase n=1 Tax=Rathayibacter toxicus TaxID=145458 RepID=A0A2S5Y9W9_9MICO|nr:histidine kinase [Rathayibacter toxicus]PPH25498.1 two-component sensor histidine kinase [Rathayibacter toxicus]PPH59200.1 two-component sensor histidine kinase [Rathayibacter toxicus]PPH61310.1 two-component sensor histidine kinase [Rathayibacter toxicus]PPH89276.1 two-component sensor histidine kinase [Rathayibacter toxicus]PPI17102.1 two-component sensor histidine kinase [Rathayibacter toxicus]